MTLKARAMAQGWRKLREWGVAKFFVLLFFPLFGRPLDFVNGPQRRSYAFAKWGWALPFAAASVWAKAMVTLYNFVSQSDFDVYAQRVGAQKAHTQVITIGKLLFLETFILICVIVGAVAVLRFFYFLLVRLVLTNFRKAPQNLPFRYFLTATSSTLFLCGCVVWGVAIYVRHVSGAQSVLRLVGEKGVVIVLAVLGLLVYRGLQNRLLGVKELYKSSLIPLFVDVFAFCLLSGLLHLVLIFGAGV